MMLKEKAINRRRFLQSSAQLGAASALLTTSAGCADSVDSADSAENSAYPELPPAIAGRERWLNWSANQSCQPTSRLVPANTDELIEGIKAASGTIRAVGSGHSFSALVPTDDTLIATDLLSGLVAYDAENNRATVQGGTRLSMLGPLLDGIGQAMSNLPDMNYPSVAGALATSTHGTGKTLGSIASQVQALKLVTVDGQEHSCSAANNPDLFNAMRTSLGALGIVTEVTLQNQQPYKLTEVTRVEDLNEVLEGIDQRANDNRHFEIFPFPHASVCMTVTTNPAVPGDQSEGEEDIYAVDRIKQLYDILAAVPGAGLWLYEKIFSKVLAAEPATVRTGKSYEVLTHIRQLRFREMEYTVPAEQGAVCLREIMHTIKKKRLPVFFPMEYRYVKADDAWLSMFQGQDGCSISVHEYGNVDYRPLFAEIEPIFWKYGGRPHWGKLHTLQAEQLAELYPQHWRDFTELRRELDPTGRLLNAHLATLLG